MTTHGPNAQSAERRGWDEITPPPGYPSLVFGLETNADVCMPLRGMKHQEVNPNKLASVRLRKASLLGKTVLVVAWMIAAASLVYQVGQRGIMSGDALMEEGRIHKSMQNLR